MIESSVWIFRAGDWRSIDDSNASLGANKNDHAERALYLKNESRIREAGSLAAFVQNGAPCETCHAFFAKKSSDTTFIFAVGSCGHGNETAGEGYPILKGTKIIPVILNPTAIDQDGNEQASIKYPSGFPNKF